VTLKMNLLKKKKRVISHIDQGTKAAVVALKEETLFGFIDEMDPRWNIF